MQWNEPKCYAVKHLDENVVAASRSGGIFTALSDMALRDNGVVYGCVLTDDFRAVHIRADNDNDRNRMRGSKYVQSSLGDTLRNVKADLTAGKKVLFTGTSCQVAGLKAFLGKEWPNLLCVDIVCHGVPSPLIWEKYLEWQAQKNNSKVATVNFRNKQEFGWREHFETLNMRNETIVHSKVFTTLFYSHNILRPSCYRCPYKKTVHPGDITIADYWGIESAAPEFDDNKGVSLVLVNNDRGQIAFEKAKGLVKWKQTRLKDSMQTALIKPFAVPPERKFFWHDFYTKSFEKVVYLYTGRGLSDRIKRKIIKILSTLQRKFRR